MTENDVTASWMEHSQDMWRCGMNASTKFMQAATKVWSHLPTVPTTLEEVKARNEKVVDHATPFMRRNMDVCMDAVNAQMKRNMDAFGDMWKGGDQADRLDVTAQSRRVWDEGFEMTRRHWDAMADTGVKLAESWTQFCNEMSAPAATGNKPAAKSTK